MHFNDLKQRVPSQRVFLAVQFANYNETETSQGIIATMKSSHLSQSNSFIYAYEHDFRWLHDSFHFSRNATGNAKFVWAIIIKIIWISNVSAGS